MKNTTINIRISTIEKDYLTNLANKENLSVSQYIIKSTLSDVKKKEMYYLFTNDSRATRYIIFNRFLEQINKSNFEKDILNLIEIHKKSNILCDGYDDNIIINEEYVILKNRNSEKIQSIAKNLI